MAIIMNKIVTSTSILLCAIGAPLVHNNKVSRMHLQNYGLKPSSKEGCP